jgi:hypothetical protein
MLPLAIRDRRASSIPGRAHRLRCRDGRHRVTLRLSEAHTAAMTNSMTNVVLLANNVSRALTWGSVAEECPSQRRRKLAGFPPLHAQQIGSNCVRRRWANCAVLPPWMTGRRHALETAGRLRQPTTSVPISIRTAAHVTQFRPTPSLGRRDYRVSIVFLLLQRSLDRRRPMLQCQSSLRGAATPLSGNLVRRALATPAKLRQPWDCPVPL